MAVAGRLGCQVERLHASTAHLIVGLVDAEVLDLEQHSPPRKIEAHSVAPRFAVEAHGETSAVIVAIRSETM